MNNGNKQEMSKVAYEYGVREALQKLGLWNDRLGLAALGGLGGAALGAGIGGVAADEGEGVRDALIGAGIGGATGIASSLVGSHLAKRVRQAAKEKKWEEAAREAERYAKEKKQQEAGVNWDKLTRPNPKPADVIPPTEYKRDPHEWF